MNNEVKQIEAFDKQYKEIKEKCINAIKNYNKSIIKETDNEEVKKATKEFIRMNEGGKYLRAFLVALGYKATGKTDDNYLSLAITLEIFQTAVLIHDDIIDKATIRRGKPTIPVNYQNTYLKSKDKEAKELSDSIAICLGDMGFYLATQLIIDSYKTNQNLTDILSYYHTIALKTYKGEMIDIILPYKSKHQNQTEEEDIMEMYTLKTSWYSVVGPYCLGLKLGGQKDTKEIEKLLINIGIAYQIKDDILGIYGDKQKIGKETNTDIEEYKQTILYSYAIKTKYKEELLKYYGKPNLTEEEINKVKEILEKSGAKDYAINKMENLFRTSLENIKKTNHLNKEAKENLINFITYLRK